MSTTDELFGAPLLFDGENPQTYDRMQAEVSAAVGPKDIVDKILLRDHVAHTMEVPRLRSVAVNLIKAKMYKGLAEILAPIEGRAQAETLAEGWAARKPDVVDKVDKILASAGLSMDTVLAQTFAMHLNEIERLENLIGCKEARRNAALREIDRRRQTPGHTTAADR
jgi:hypothetical protein